MTWAWVWALVALALALLLAWNAWQLSRLARWLADPARGVPEASGNWDRVFSALHRHERDAAQREKLLTEALARFRHAAQALPDGVVILDADNHIEWCNDNAAVMLGLNARADTGQPIGNLVRAPRFVQDRKSVV